MKLSPLLLVLFLAAGCTSSGGRPQVADPGPSAGVPTGSQGVVFGHGLEWSELEPWNTPDLRRSFLLGMTEQNPLLGRDGTGFETFGPNETRAEPISTAVAQLYARDLGHDPLRSAPEAWKRAAAPALQPFVNQGPPADLKGKIACLAGVHVRHGIPAGFRFPGTRGFLVGELIARTGGHEIQLNVHPGFPGGSTLTVPGENGQPSPLFALLAWVEAGVQKEADPTAIR